MNVKVKVRGGAFAAILLSMGAVHLGLAETADQGQVYPKHLPYSFENLVWWSDDELRSLLKKRIRGLGDEIATTHAAEGQMRDALTALLKERGIAAEIQSQEPSTFSLTAARDPEAPAPSVQFRVLHPSVLVDKVHLEGVPQEVIAKISSDAHRSEGKPYESSSDWLFCSQFKSVLRQKGFLDPVIHVSRQPVHKLDGQYAVDLVVSVETGPPYRVFWLNADGGPLLAGKDLSRFFSLKPGDLADRDPFEQLGLQLRLLYQHAGFEDVDIQSKPTLDREHRTVSYRLTLNPGPLYKLRSLRIEELSEEQEARVRTLFGMRVGEVFRDDVINALYRQIADEPLLKTYSFTFSVKKDKDTQGIDLTLSFYKEGSEGSVTIR